MIIFKILYGGHCIECDPDKKRLPTHLNTRHLCEGCHEKDNRIAIGLVNAGAFTAETIEGWSNIEWLIAQKAFTAGQLNKLEEGLNRVKERELKRGERLCGHLSLAPDMEGVEDGDDRG